MKFSTDCCYLLVILIHSLNPSRGDYIFRAQVHSYLNPTNHCVECGGTCCDGNDGTCTSGERCDNVFLYCVRILGTPKPTVSALEDTASDDNRATPLQCIQSRSSSVNNDGGSIDFSRPTFLGIPNPMEFPVIASGWEGIQFYLDVIDRDSFFTVDDEVVDAFLVDISQSMIAAGSGMTEVMPLSGIFGIANTMLSFEVECSPGFVGESCVPVCSTDPCSNNGTCLQSVSGFTCACRGDFTGETCETTINDCQDVDCNDGTCVDGVLSFTCQCDPGFTGDFCEDGITTSVATTMTSTPDGATITTSAPDDATSTTTPPDGTTSSNIDATLIGVVAGTTVGVVLLVAILITIICSICIKVPSGEERIPEDIPTTENVVYGIKEAETHAPESKDIPTTENVVYGIHDVHEDIPTTRNLVYGIKGTTASNEDGHSEDRTYETVL